MVVTEKESGYQLEVDNEYIMSPKDLCTIGFVDRMIDAGVRVLKIEGRARSPEYVSTVCSCYDEAVTAVIDGTYSPEKIEGWRQRLSTVFNRDSGMVITWDKHWGNGTTGTDRQPP